MTLESISAVPSSATSVGAFRSGLSFENWSMCRNSEIGRCLNGILGDDQRDRDPAHIGRIEHSDQLHVRLVGAQGTLGEWRRGGKSIADPDRQDTAAPKNRQARTPRPDRGNAAAGPSCAGRACALTSLPARPTATRASKASETTVLTTLAAAFPRLGSRARPRDGRPRPRSRAANSIGRRSAGPQRAAQRIVPMACRRVIGRPLRRDPDRRGALSRSRQPV